LAALAGIFGRGIHPAIMPNRSELVEWLALLPLNLKSEIDNEREGKWLSDMDSNHE
jgi:hypothetical protein